jgi:hypothetical protein
MKELLGTWRLQSFTTEDLETHEKTQPYGEHPSGYLSYGADHRMFAMIVEEGRKGPAAPVETDPEIIKLFHGLAAAYAGSYSIDGDIVSHHVDISWNQSWTGTTQTRQFKIEGSSLHIRSRGKDTRTRRENSYLLVWTKVE